ncbi:CPBP family intramembrane metalloprotease [Methanosarcina sp. MSH10X1]|nr:CPBP family intramembrane metalloprotease [Methanosarcina sp. MSH10X1]
MPSRTFEEARDSRVTSTSYENLSLFNKIRLYLDVYKVGGIVTALVILFIYPRVTWRESNLTKNSLKTLYPFKTRKVAGTEGTIQENFELRKRRFLTAIPILCIALAEMLIFLGAIKIAIFIHIGSLIALSLSNIYIHNPETQKIYQALMLLPILRLINLSMPVFFETTLYIFIFIYGSLAIPVAVIILHQRHSLEQIGISMKNIGAYMVLSIPLSFILGFGEYLTIRSEYLIPDLGFENLLKLTVIMVFFVGLIEELIFRSILQTRLAKALSISESLIITSILFGLMHSGYGTTYEILYTTFVGFLMGLLFYKTKSLPFIAVLHGFINVFLFGIFPHYLSGWTGF